MTKFEPGDRVFFVGTRATRGNAADVVFASSPEWGTVVNTSPIGPRVPIAFDEGGPEALVRHVLESLIVSRWDAPVPDPRSERVSQLDHTSHAARSAYLLGRSDEREALTSAVRQAVEEALS